MTIGSDSREKNKNKKIKSQQFKLDARNGSFNADQKLKPNLSSKQMLATRDPSSAINFGEQVQSGKKREENVCTILPLRWFADFFSSSILGYWLASPARNCFFFFFYATRGQFSFNVFFKNRPPSRDVQRPTRGMIKNRDREREEKKDKRKREKKRPNLVKQGQKYNQTTLSKLHIDTVVNLQINNIQHIYNSISICHLDIEIAQIRE